MTLKEQHDKLLEEKPEGAVHDTEGCPFCNDSNNEDSNGGGADMKTYTEDEFNAAVAAAIAAETAKVETKLADIQTKLDAANADHAQAAATATIEDLQDKLDKADLKATAAEEQLTNLMTYLKAEDEAKVEAAAREARKDARLAAVKEVAHFSDERIAERTERWVAMSDEDFDAMIEDYKETAAASAAALTETALESGTKVPAETALNNVRDDKATVSTASSVFSARNAGIDIRQLNI